MKQYHLLFSITAVFFLVSVEIAYAQSLEETISTFSFFLRNIILPFLFSVAFLYFLINMVKYFIMQGASDEGRAKAKRSAIYGIAAFVFLFSLWTIVSWVVDGVLGGTTYNESLCPDYLGDFCNDQNRSLGPVGASFPNGTPTNGTGGSTSGSGGYTGGSGSGSGGGSTSGSGGTITAPLAELVFGTGRDSASFTTYRGNPRGALNTVFLSETTSCQDGLEALRIGSQSETTQGAYLLYKNNTNAVRWKNITDLNSTNHISYDKDVIESVVNSGAKNVYIVHLHPESTVSQQGIAMDGRGPSAADMRAMCEIDNPEIAYLTVDWTGVWSMTQQNDTCPYNTTANTILPLLETYNYTASVESSHRTTELERYIASPLVAATYKNHFASLNLESFTNYSPTEIMQLSSGYQTYASTSITYSQSIDTFCNNY